MRAAVLLASAAVLLVAAEDAEDAVKKEVKKFEGAWAMLAGEKEGKKVADEHVKKSKITWKGKNVSLFTPHQSKDSIEAEVRIDPTKSPKQIDWVRSAGPHKGKKMLGIYEFVAEDEYRICFALPGKDRPTTFTTKPGSGHLLHRWKRKK